MNTNPALFEFQFIKLLFSKKIKVKNVIRSNNFFDWFYVKSIKNCYNVILLNGELILFLEPLLTYNSIWLV